VLPAPNRRFEGTLSAGLPTTFWDNGGDHQHRPDRRFGRVSCGAANGRDVGRGVSLGQYGAFVPRLSAFHGIAVYMYIRDHGVGHFHARYGEHEAVLAVASDQVLEGRLPRRQLAMVREWARLHRAELAAAWQKAALGEPPGTIEPLP